MNLKCGSLLFVFLLTSYVQVFAQSAKLLKGAVFQQGTNARIEHVLVFNQNTGKRTLTDGLGIFEMMCSVGDTLKLSLIGYMDQQIGIGRVENIKIQLRPNNQLAEVKIISKTASKHFAEISAAYSKEKGIFYGGKPPIGLLSPFGGSPLTFFHELLGKDGKRVRRLNQLAKEAELAEEIERRFSDLKILGSVPISKEQLAAFKILYTPKLAELRKWSDYQLVSYIKASYEEFMKK
ncbi:carboxypeptidase-like regulatory domain-containing protein [Pedobacter frigoris]|uniref:carboxypeptidase-like regulatory domain-containing protein n=1 Tax=Pedobacter frigoris TaxID=2571272 RepID=UPI00292DD628|nr:carboxypeptidase-like regulatory domain-containing protein [Pedobacter frigoris]